MFYATNENNVIQIIRFDEQGNSIKSKEEAQRIKDTYYPGYSELKETSELSSLIKAA